MRLLNSVCKVISDKYSGVPVHIKEVPKNFERPCFLVVLTTAPKQIKSRNVYEKNPTFQIIYFGERDEANQVLADPLYEVEETLEEILLLSLVLPVLPKSGVTEKQRYAKIESFSSNVRLNEGALYCNLSLNFTEDIPREVVTDIIEDVELDVRASVPD